MFDEEELRSQALVEKLVAAIRQGGVAGYPDWEERTKDQQFSEKMKTHGWPPGLAKSTRWKRERLAQEVRARVQSLSPEKDDARKALAWALDAERFLGAFNRGAPGRFPAAVVNKVAEHLLVWLRERGFRIVPSED